MGVSYFADGKRRGISCLAAGLSGHVRSQKHSVPVHPFPDTCCRDCGIPRDFKETFVPTRTLYFFSKFWSIQMCLAACFRCSRWKQPFIGTARGLLGGLATVLIIFARFVPRYLRTHALPVFVPHMSLISSFKQSVHQVPSSSCSRDFQTGPQRCSLKCIAILPSVGSSMGSPVMSHYPYCGMWAVLEILVFLRGTC